MLFRLPVILSIAFGIALLLAPLALDDWRLSQLAQLLTYGLFALSLSFIWGQAGILCFGQAIFFGVGAYVMALVTLGRFPVLGDSQLMGLLLATVAAGGVAFVLGLFLFGGRGITGAHLAVVTLCAAVIIEIAAGRWAFIGGFNGLRGVPPLTTPWQRDDIYLSGLETYFLVFAVLALVYFFLLWLTQTSFGTLLAAIRSNEVRTRFLGFDVTKAKLFAFFLSGMVAGLAGALFAAQFGFVSPQLIGFALSTEVLIWVAVGGRGVLLAAVVGALLVRWGEDQLSDQLGQYWLLATGLLFIIIVVMAPRGLFGRVLDLSARRKS